MSLLVILMCFRGMADCTDYTAPMVLRSTHTTAECIARAEKITTNIKAGLYPHPPGGWYVLRCDEIGPKA